MKKIMKFLIVFMALTLLLSPAVSGAQNDNKKDSKNVTQTEKPAVAQGSLINNSTVSNDSQIKKNQTDSSNASNNDDKVIPSKNNSSSNNDIKDRIQIQQQNMTMEYLNLSSEEQNKLKNQNQVRLAVQSLLMAGDIQGIGQEISQIAQEFNNSIQSTYSAEEKIQNRNIVLKMLFGGDSDSAAEIERNIEENQNRIELLYQYINECDCDEELRQLLEEQVMTLQEEQTRLSQIAEEEQNSKGLLGGFFT